MSNQEMPIFTRTFDFLSWLVPATNNFPRSQRFYTTKRLLDAAFDLREYLEEANIRRGNQLLKKLPGFIYLLFKSLINFLSH